jgi:hypothetical protein
LTTKSKEDEYSCLGKWVRGAVDSNRSCPATRHGSGTASPVCHDARDAYIVTAA